MIPANRERKTTIHLTDPAFERIRSDRRFGIFDRINRYTVPMVPAIIMMTFQSISPRASTKVYEKPSNTPADPTITKMAAEASAIYGRSFCSVNMSI